MRFDVVRVPAEQSLTDYLNSGWMENVDKVSTEEVTINEFPGRVGVRAWRPVAVQGLCAALRQRRLPLHLRRQAETTESDRNARETVNSFRRLTLNEIQAARPLRIKVITVQPGDTVESLSHRMSGVDRAASVPDPERAGARAGENARQGEDRGGLRRGRASSPMRNCASGVARMRDPMSCCASAGSSQPSAIHAHRGYASP